MSWPWETRTSTCLNFATISSGLYRFLAIAVLLDVETYLKSDHFVGGGSPLKSLFGRRLHGGLPSLPGLADCLCEVVSLGCPIGGRSIIGLSCGPSPTVKRTKW